MQDVKKLEMPGCLTPAFLDELGRASKSEAELRDAIKESLERRMEYSQRQEARKQILASLTVAANWDLPPELLKRQSRRELERTVLELRRSGFSEDEIRSHGNELMQNSQQSTAKSLKEHFILERIAEDEKIEDLPEDYDAEIGFDCSAKRRESSPGACAAGKAQLDGHAAKPDHRAESDRPGFLAVPSSKTRARTGLNRRIQLLTSRPAAKSRKSLQAMHSEPREPLGVPSAAIPSRSTRDVVPLVAMA